MEGYCGICLNQQPNVEWNELTYRLECSAHRSADLTVPLTAAPRTEVIDARSGQSDEPAIETNWSEVDALCSRLSAVLDVNDPSYEIEDWHRAQERLRAQDKRRLIHAPNCNLMLRLGGSMAFPDRCDCKPEWK